MVSATKRFATPVDVVVEEVFFISHRYEIHSQIWSDEPYSKKLTEVILFLVPDTDLSHTFLITYTGEDRPGGLVQSIKMKSELSL